MESKWEDLPMDLLVRVLSLVDNQTKIAASNVCTGWRITIQCCISELSFSWCNRNMSNLVQSVSAKFTQLQVCVMRNKRLTDQAVEALAKNCHKLRVLDLSNGTLITDASLFALSQGCQSLEKLNLSGCVTLSEPGLRHLVDHSSNLLSLNLCGCSKAGSDQVISALARHCSALKALNVGWCDTITDAGVTSLASWCRDLCNIDLCGCLLITDQSVIALAENCHQLRVLGLYSCICITDAAMYALAKSGKYWNHILGSHTVVKHGNFISHTSVDSCNRNMVNGGIASSNQDSCYFPVHDTKPHGLISLNLGMCTHLSAVAVQAVCDAFPGLHTCPERHSLMISGCLNLTSVHCVCGVEARRERIPT